MKTSLIKANYKILAEQSAALNYRVLRRKYSAATPSDGITQQLLARDIVSANSDEEKGAAIKIYADFLEELARRSRNNNALAGIERR